MIKLFSAIAALALALGSICAFGAELNDAERTELRQRAERMQAQGPTVQDDVKLNPNKGDVRLDQKHSDVKVKPAKAKKAKGAKAKPKPKAKPEAKSKDKKKKRSLEDIPGALVR